MAGFVVGLWQPSIVRQGLTYPEDSGFEVHFPIGEVTLIALGTPFGCSIPSGDSNKCAITLGAPTRFGRKQKAKDRD